MRIRSQLITGSQRRVLEPGAQSSPWFGSRTKMLILAAWTLAVRFSKAPKTYCPRKAISREREQIILQSFHFKMR